MSTTHGSQAARKLYPAIELTGRWLTPQPARMLLAGLTAALTITVEGRKAVAEYYWIGAHIHKGEIVGWRMTKEEADGEFGESYDLPADLSGACECKDRLVRERENGLCKHGVALRKALRAIGLFY